MSRRKTTVSNSSSSSKNDYEVGYRKPPKHSQFRPGHSGNPHGRRKGLRNLVTDVKSTLGTPVKVKEGGRMCTRSTQEGVLMVLREKALRGHPRAIDRCVELAVRFNNDAAEVGSAQALAADDQAILAAYEAEIVAAAMARATPKSPDPTSKPGASSGRKTPK
jgi:Family of unknown function (DUF5681)